jgi:hypothetical protein
MFIVKGSTFPPNQSFFKISNLKDSFESINVQNLTFSFNHPESENQMPILILYPTIEENLTLPLLLFALGYFCKPDYPCYSNAVNFLKQLVIQGYVIALPTHSMAYYDVTQQDGAKTLFSLKNFLLDEWEGQIRHNSSIKLSKSKVSYIGISDGGGTALIAGVIDPSASGVVIFAPYLTLNQIYISLSDYYPPLLAIGGTQDPGASPDNLKYLSTLLDYNERQIYIVFINCDHSGYYNEPYIQFSISMTLVFCNYHLKNDSNSYENYFGANLFSHELAQELDFSHSTSEGGVWLVFFLSFVLITSLILVRYYCIKRKLKNHKKFKMRN